MNTITKKIITSFTWLIVSSFFLTLNTAVAESDVQLQEKALKAREMMRHEGMDHAMHGVESEQKVDSSFRGVFYGYLPCYEKECSGHKMTLSLKPKNNYLLVSQYAKPASREHYEKGKYEWNEKNHSVTLIPNNSTPPRQLSMLDESALVVLSGEGKTFPGDQEPYTLRRSDKSKTREVHIH